MQAVLEITKGEDSGRVFHLDAEKIVVGRGAECEIRLADSQVSRRHAAFVQRGGRYEIEDLESSNGTIVNGAAVTRRALLDGDVILLGTTQLVFVQPDGAEATAARPSDTQEETQTLAVNEGELLAQWFERQDVEALHRARSDLEAVYRVGRVIGAVLDTAQLLPMILDIVFQELTEVDRGSVHLLEPRSGELICRANRTREGATDEGPPALSTTMAQQAILEKRAMLTFDAMADARFKAGESIQNQCIRSAICAPLQSKDRVVGVLYADTAKPDHRFTRDDLRFLAAVGLQAGIAVENARLYEHLAEEKAALHEANLQLVQAQERLIQSEKLAAVGRLASGIVHDIKNPMAVIMGYAGLIRKRLEEGQPGWLDDLNVRKPLDDIEKGIEHCNEVIAHLLQFARPSAPSKSPTDMNALVRETLNFLAHELGKANVQVEDRLAADLPPVMADGNQIKQVFLNILLNSIQAMDKAAPRLAIRSRAVERADGMQVELAFEDNGCGMTTESRRRAFEPFYSTKEKGTGLGLSVSYGIIAGHGGALSVESEPGKGTTFLVKLPAGA